MSEISLEDCRARGIGLPADDGAAQDIIDGEEAWLARRIGALVGARTERFFVGIGITIGKLGLRRYTDAVSLTDGGAVVNTATYRLIDLGSAVIHLYTSPNRIWTGPYVEATYTPNDEDEVRRVLFNLVALSAQPPSVFESEQIGSYSYRRGGASSATLTPAAQRAAWVSELLPKHDPLLTLYSARRTNASDPVINRREPGDPYL